MFCLTAPGFIWETGRCSSTGCSRRLWRSAALCSEPRTQHEADGFPLYVTALILLALSPTFLSVVGGTHQPLRGQLAYVFVFAFFLAGITTFTKKSLAVLCCLISVFVTLRQSQSMTQLFHTAFVTYNQDKDLASSIYERIEQIAADSGMADYPVVFVGSRSANLTDGAQKGEMIGVSFLSGMRLATVVPPDVSSASAIRWDTIWNSPLLRKRRSRRRRLPPCRYGPPQEVFRQWMES